MTLNESSVSSTKRFWTLSSSVTGMLPIEQPRDPVVVLGRDDDLRRHQRLLRRRDCDAGPCTRMEP